MNGTPRMRSAYPATPKSNYRARDVDALRQSFGSPQSSARPSPVTKPVQSVAPTPTPAGGPLIPLETIDAPTQRFYIAAFYAGLCAWRIYNALNVTDDLDSTWLFLKWIGIDAAFFVGLPALRIPWLEWSFATTLTTWLLHVIVNAFLMYRIPIPVLAWLGALFKVAYDRELTISENRVNPQNVLHNSSIILGKQIIQILPEGSAILNPQKLSFCLDSSRTSIELPIQINQTTPISIELLRYDLETDEPEMITINAKQAKRLKNEADRGHAKSDTNTPRTLLYPVTKKGLYQLSRVIDQSKLEVRKRSYDVAVVACPKAVVVVDALDKCTGDLSGISLHVNGVPPFRVKYSKRINQHQYSSITQSIQPPDMDQMLATEDGSNVLVDPKHPHRALARSEGVSVDINEALDQNGTWSYHVEEVEDGLGNKAMFDTDSVKKVSADEHFRSFTVHRRPVVKLVGCNSEKALRVAKEDTTNLPVKVESANQLPSQDWPLTLKYTFTPESDSEILPLEEIVHEMSDEKVRPRISKAGKYRLDSVETQFCKGQVDEPSVCVLYNPPRPDLVIETENIFDKCAGNPIGMNVNLDFTGTPPFKVRYVVSHRGKATPKEQPFETMRGQIRFQEHSAGSYTYQFMGIQDEVYGPISLKDRPELILKQDIKPPASARFADGARSIPACLGQSVSVPVRMEGEGPWKLDYEIVHGGKRRKHSIESEDEHYIIQLPEQSDGGKYSLVLTGVSDRSKCRTVLTEERHIEVRPERPSASFGNIAGRRTSFTLEGKSVKIPLKLQGASPWTVKIQNTNTSSVKEHTLRDANAVITEHAAGIYELLSVHDTCPGVVDPKANKFQISYIDRPKLDIKDNSVEPAGVSTYRKRAVCQGDEDILSLILSGNPPYQLSYQQKSEPLKGSAHIANRPLSVASHNAMINMDTSKAGEYTYTFNELSDDRYVHDRKHFSPLTIRQQVFAPPTAKFTNPGKTYGYCKDDIGSADESSDNVPITLTGTPPFSIEIATTHHSSSVRPEITRIKDIRSTSFLWALSRSSYDLGTHTLQIRSVKDGHGCESLIETNPSSIRIHVSSPPTINPLDSTTDYCIGDHVSFSLSGQAPFDIFYNFQNRERKARVSTHEFKRLIDSPGELAITGVSDEAMGPGGKCRAKTDIRKTIHPYPSVRISQGKTSINDIHEGGEVDIHFEFTGTPPFEFTYTRSENLSPKSRNKNKKPTVLETRHDTSNEFTKTIRASEEGTYEVVAIKDRYCAYSAAGGMRRNGVVDGAKKLLKNV